MTIIDVWFLRYGAWQTEFFVILDHFLPFYPPNNLKNQNFEKMKKSTRDIILHMCTINDNHWCMVPEIRSVTDRIFCNFGPFLPFHPLKNPNNQNFETWKNLQEISPFYKSVPKIKIIWCMVPEIWNETDRIFCHSGLLFALLPHSVHQGINPPQNITPFFLARSPLNLQTL